MDIGKIPADILERIVLNPINRNKNRRDEIIIRPKTGEDCSAVDMKGELCIVSTDPITGADNNAGYIAVHINCNDIASSGGEPVGILITVLLPKGSTEELLEEIMNGAYKAANEIGIEILGGHTEVTEVVVKPVISAAVIGKSNNMRFISSGGAKVGQSVIMTKWAGLEGTSIIATDYYDKLKYKIDENILKSAMNMSGFLSVVPESKIALEHGATAMHDVTEGGIFGAVWEVADCSDTGIIIYEDKIPVKNETSEICKAANINPYSLISSGSMIITAFDGDSLVNKLNLAGIEAAIIGEITESGKYIKSKSGKRPLLPPESDELYKVKL